MKRLVIGALCMLISLAAMAQEKVKTTLGTDFVSQYIWRGQSLGSVSIQPTMGISWQGLSLSAWGNTGLANFNDTQEVDLTLSYGIGGFSVGVTDYWFTGGAPYFDYGNPAATHVFEATVGYDFGWASIAWFTNFAGADGLNPAGQRAYSSYAEVKVPFGLGGVDWEGALGVVPYATDFYYADGFRVVNVSLTARKTLVETEHFQMPVFATLMVNPAQRQTFFAVGLSLSCL